MDRYSLGDNLRRLRLGKRLSTYKLSFLLEIPRETINAIEGKTILNPSMKTLLKLADYFEVSLDELIGRNINESNK